jgi:hypothetical protein
MGFLQIQCSRKRSPDVHSTFTYRLPATATVSSLCRLQTVYSLKSRFDPLRERGTLTISEITQTCGVSTIGSAVV